MSHPNQVPTRETHTPAAEAGQPQEKPTIEDGLGLVDRWWRAANYLSVGQIYLRSNPLLRRPLQADDTKSRLLGHWGTTPGLNFIYAHLNRVIRRDRQEMLFVACPGHGGPALVANGWLEGTYSEIYDHVFCLRGGSGRHREGAPRLRRRLGRLPRRNPRHPSRAPHRVEKSRANQR